MALQTKLAKNSKPDSSWAGDTIPQSCDRVTALAASAAVELVSHDLQARATRLYAVALSWAAPAFRSRRSRSKAY